MNLPDPETTDDSDAYAALLQFLYRVPVGLVQTNLDGEVEMMNPKAAQMLMPLATDASLDNLFQVLSPMAPDLRKMSLAVTAPSGEVCDSLRVDVSVPLAGGRTVRSTLSISIFKFDGNRLLAMLGDVTLEVQREQAGLERRLRDAARLDLLTQMPNREVVKDRLFAIQTQQTSDDQNEFAVLFMNCDRFKQINDALGVAVGDEMLGMLAERLRATLRLTDRVGRSSPAQHIAARVGGDEFVVLLDNLLHPDDAHAVAQRLLDVLAKPYGIGPHQLYCGVSMGVVMKAQASGDADAVMQDASIAMVEAKRAGGGRYVVFETAMQAAALLRSRTEAQLRQALAQQQLFVVYQPVVGLDKSGDIDVGSGVEALVRWEHPQRGLVSPVEFIGLAEECGLIGAIGEFVLDSACGDFMQWQRSHPQAPRLLAVNLSRAQIEQPDVVSMVAKTLQTHQMPAHQLQLEITESLAAQSVLVQQQLSALKALGLTLALDDFGTGYSSLSSLHQFPVDVVKIDRSFTAQGDTSAHHRVLIEATVRVAQSLGMQTVAEGIETTSQAAVITALGCDKGQGYLYSHPLTAEQMQAWMARVSTEGNVDA